MTVRSATGSVPAILRLDECLREDLVEMPVSGTLASGTAVNLLIPAVMARDGACPAYNDAFVRIAPD